jgi:translation initiation factor 1
MAKKQRDQRGVVWSTDPDFRFEPQQEEVPVSQPASQQKLRVWIDRKQRKGKEVTLVTGFIGSEADLQALGKTLKTRCGSGGTAKDNEIILQGNHRDKVVQWLQEMGYTQAKSAGG